MRHILITALAFLITISVNAQQTEVPVETEWTVPPSQLNNRYFKDVNNVLDKFVGTWKYENTLNNAVFEITFSKLLHQETHENSFVDELDAQFKLTVNGVEIYNTYTTPCENCIISDGFLSEKVYQTLGDYENFLILPPNVNTYFMAIAEPDIEKHVLSSDLKLEFNLGSNGNADQLTWTNKVDLGKDSNTNQIVNNYEMPLNMVLVKQ
ncbi:DUF6705 family protein [Psychroserpens luteolus]|uniref:DUF6705 family protein n=1 Tax=Psychroserpens luteolus TaxID=2855840 RepID=UPI001E40963F|nr:DUF6705 family protein [Psychroserpens luteolus]MCD2259152.1 hypothetical protein [Psychroserpens luteolus]